MLNYEISIEEVIALTKNTGNPIANRCNTTAYLKDKFSSKISWVGFYLYDEKEDVLKLDVYQGKVPCLNIPNGKGIVGIAYKNQQSLIVSNVHEFKGHIACDSKTNSEIVIPFAFDNIKGVLDVDSYSYDAFDYSDQIYLTELIANIRRFLK